jgi:hypothetical protein
MNPCSAFLSAVLGPEGADALLKAVVRSPELGNALVPRTVFAWLSTLLGDFEGSVPGSGTAIALQKTESGYHGHIGSGDSLFRFENSSIFQVVASVSVALGVTHDQVSPRIRDFDLDKLGKSIDLIAKSQFVTRELQKKEEEQKAAKQDYFIEKLLQGLERRKPGSLKKIKEKIEKKGKEDKGPAHAPTPAEPPEPPTSVQPEPGPPAPKPQKPKMPKVPTIKLTRSEIDSECPLCGKGQFGGSKFVGCACLGSLAKSVTTVSFEEEGAILRLDPKEWGQDEIATLFESVGRR